MRSSTVGQHISSQSAPDCLLSTALLQASQQQYYQAQEGERRKKKQRGFQIINVNKLPATRCMTSQVTFSTWKIEKPFGFIGLTADDYAFYGDLFGSD